MGRKLVLPTLLLALVACDGCKSGYSPPSNPPDNSPAPDSDLNKMRQQGYGFHNPNTPRSDDFIYSQEDPKQP
jgi:hypothetical protein